MIQFKFSLPALLHSYFSNNIAKWVSGNVDVLWISADGPPEIQDFNRLTIEGKKSSKTVERNIEFFAGEEHMQTGIRITVTPSTICRQTEIIKYFSKYGIKYINVHPTCIPVGGSSNPVFQWNPIDFAKNFLFAHNEAKKLGIFYNSLYIANFDEKTRYNCRACIPYPHLTTDGYVSCCDFAQFGTEYDPSSLQQLIYGKYNPEKDKIIYDEEKICRIRSRCAENLEMGMCKGCKFVYHCAGGCVGQAVNENGNIMSIQERNCKITKYLAERMPLCKGLWPVLHS